MSENNNEKIWLGDFLYRTATRELKRKGATKTIRLTPTEASILSHLYRNQHRVVSKNELLDLVADGRVLTQDNILTHIKKIRARLGDNAADPVYIETIPKKGYRFIAKVNQVKNPGIGHYGLVSSIAIASALLITLVVWLTSEQRPLLNQQRITQVTSLKGQEMDGHTSPDGEYVVFSHRPFGHKFWELVIKKRGEENYFRLVEAESNARRARFSPSGRQLVYHRYTGTRSEIVIADLDWREKRLNNSRVLVTLPAGMLSVYMDWQDDTTLYYSTKGNKADPYHIEAINIDSGSSRLVTKPPVGGHGDLALTYSPESRLWAILRNHGWSKTEILTFDPQTQVLESVISVPRALISVAWNKQGSGLVFRGGAGQLLEISLQDKSIEPLLEAASPVYAPFRISGDTFGFMQGDLISSDIQSFDLRAVESTLLGNGAGSAGYSVEDNVVVSSAFNDSMPTVAENTGALAFVSSRSGLSQIWLKAKNGALTQLTRFEENLRLINLAIDKDARYLAYTTNAQLFIMNIESGELIFQSKNQHNAHAFPTFSDDGTSIIYSVKDESRWQLEKRRLNDIQVRQVLTEGFYAKPCRNLSLTAEDQIETENNKANNQNVHANANERNKVANRNADKDCLFFTRKGEDNLYRLTAQNEIIDTGVRLHDIQFYEQFQISGSWVYQVAKMEGGMKLLRTNLETQKEEIIAKAESRRFTLDARQGKIFWTKRTPSDTNLAQILVK
ncbi:winged helix-turn-helix domain-containing protein [Aliikangiella sp. G2MR2-5]|uniref:winged helix-turn-helix domain-containing protein n=1 Tax=Aliikangiella sp. G2MR2-5 TaxID=2788943 RepID=UPI0018A9CAA4|nr:winged helix-turn-helix domain-containing protein [Aliikangiella sp. G2MR2-5]